MSTVSDVLSSKGSSRVHTIAPAASVLEAVEKMNQLKIGSLIVMEDGQVIGVFTERDVLRRVVGEQRRPVTTPVSEVMTPEVVCCEPDTDLEEIRATMKNRRIRHIPVCDGGGRLTGVISMGDLNAFQATHREATLHYLNEYIYGRV
jgi:CBS domain-containing protein